MEGIAVLGGISVSRLLAQAVEGKRDSPESLMTVMLRLLLVRPSTHLRKLRPVAVTPSGGSALVH